MNNPICHNSFCFTVPGEPQSLALIRLIMTHLADRAGFSEEDIGKIEIAVDEACTNIIEHAYRSRSPKPPIRLEVETQSEQFIVRIKDEGDPFDYDAYVVPKFPDHWNEGNTHGVGLYLIRKCMDDSSYTRLTERGNCLRLVKRAHPAGAVR